MNKGFRFVLYGLSGVLGFVLLAFAVVYVVSQARLQKDYAIRVELGSPDTSLIEEGRRLAVTRGCADCHGADLGGTMLIDEMPFARLPAPNLTRMPAEHADKTIHERLYRALRHGVDFDSRSLLLMPKEFTNLSAREIEAIAAYVSTAPKVERELGEARLGPVGRALLVAGKLDGFLTAEAIDHQAPIVPEAPPVGSLEYGRHAAALCTGCHASDFGGGPIAHGHPGAPPASNLTPHTTGLAAWSEQDFLAAMRTGIRPDGTRIDSNMPWTAIGRSTDAELKSIWMYLRTLHPVNRNVRASQPAN